MEADMDQDRDLKSLLEFDKTATDHFATRIARALGSIPFLIAYVVILVCWLCWNTGAFHLMPFDPYPFPLLEMCVSVFAVILSVSVLINQNRQRRVDKIMQQVEFEINVRAEEEVTKILQMLHEIQHKLGIETEDSELEKMKRPIDLDQIQKKLDSAQDETEEL
jgi:uncharacterized membrane protein